VNAPAKNRFKFYIKEKQYFKSICCKNTGKYWSAAGDIPMVGLMLYGAL
jgi:hypothetical protein